VPTFRTLRLAVIALVVATGLGASSATSAATSPAYDISARALLGPLGTDVYVKVSREAAPAPALLDKVTLKAWPLTSGAVQTRNFFDVLAPGGIATLHLDGLARAQRIEVSAHVKDGPQHNLDAEAFVRRRPDLVVRDLIVPSDVTRRKAFDVRVSVAEADDDTGATAVVTLSDGIAELGQQVVSVTAGGQTDAVFGISLPTHGVHQLRATISGAAPFESDGSNNVRTADLYAHRYLANGVVSTEDSAATAAGVEILDAGGNAFDAAAAVLFALNVTEPHLAGIGGAANVVVQLEDGRRYAIDGRETAPIATTADMYKGFPANVDYGLNGFAVGVPGALRAVDEMLARWGTMSLERTLQPAIRLAEDGITVGAFLANDAGSARVPRMTPELQAVFRPGGVPVQKGQLLKQPDLAKTFRLIAAQGKSVFYRGEIAQAIVDAQHWKSIPQGEGRMTLVDLAGYDVRVEEPLSLDYGAYTILGAPPSTCGGLVMLEALGLIDHFRKANPDYPWQFGTPETLHVMIDALRLAYADRDMWIGDDDFFAVPAAGLLSDGYLTARSALITPGYAANPHAAIPGTPAPGNPFPFGTATGSEASVSDEANNDSHTTHFSVLDKWGNAVVFTATVTDSFGSGILVPGYGFVLNDTSVNFNSTPLANPATGNPGANDAAPGKRARGNTAPTLLVRDGEPAIGTGSLAARFIPSIVLNVVLNAVDFGMPIQQAVDAPRIWSQDANGAAAVNPGLSAAIEPTRALGHMTPWAAAGVNRTPSGGASLGSANSFAVDGDTITLHGAADATRHPDATAVVLDRP